MPRLAYWLLPLVAFAAGAARAATPVVDGLRRYSQNLREVDAQLDEGAVAEARRLLRTTEKTLHGFEYHYLQTRAKDAAVEGAAPDLLRVVEVPTPESRYGVLDEVGRRLVFLCPDGAMRVYDLSGPMAEPRAVERPEGGPIWSGDFSGDGSRFFAGYESGEVVVWDASSWQPIETVDLGERWPVRQLEASPDGSAFVAEGKRELQLWRLDGGRPERVAGVGERYRFGEGLAFSPAGDLLATGGMFDILLHDAATGELVKSLTHASYTMGLAFSPDGRRVASATRGNVNKLLAVFDVQRAECLCDAGPFEEYLTGLAFSPDGKRIAATGCGQRVRLFDAATGEEVFAFERPECGANPAFSRDGRLLGWSEPQGYVFIDLGKLPVKKR